MQTDNMIVLDTNAIIEHLDGKDIGLERLGPIFYVSAVTEAELLRLPGLGSGEISTVERFLFRCHVVPVDSTIARLAAILGRTRRTKLLDLFVAATALTYGGKLMTRNTRDFRNVPGLEIVTP